MIRQQSLAGGGPRLFWDQAYEACSSRPEAVLLLDGIYGGSRRAQEGALVRTG